MTRRIGRLAVVSVAALLFTVGVAFGHDPKKKSGHMMDECGGHHAAAMKASDEIGTHLAEAKRSTTLADMRIHVEAADKAYSDMKTHMHQCMEMMGKTHGEMGAVMGSGTAEKRAAGKIVDPVCNMEVDAKTAPTVVYKGKTYYFCSEEDKAKFEKNPEQYVQ